MHDRLRQLAPAHTSADQAQAIASWHAHVSKDGKRGAAVYQSDDLDRVIALPRRPPLDLAERGADLGLSEQALVHLMGQRLRRPRQAGECECARLGVSCVLELLAAQAWALYEAQALGGLFAPIGVGHGKTFLDILLAMVVPNCRLAVLLIPPGLRVQLQREYLRLREHWLVPSIRMGEWGHMVEGRPVLHVVPYSMLSRPDATKLFENLQPDLIIGDEAHLLCNRDSARVRRLLRYAAEHWETRACFYSGTLMKRSLGDCAHLAAFALKGGSPLPLDPDVVDRWAAAVDPVPGEPSPPGALRVFVEDGSLYRGFHRRMVETPGVVATRSGAIGASIKLRDYSDAAGRRARNAAPLVVPPHVLAMLREVRLSGTRPDGEESTDALQLRRWLLQLACGHYSRWKYPRGESEDLIDKWFGVRQDFNRELRAKLLRAQPHLDSPHLCERAAARYYRDLDLPDEDRDESLPRWSSVIYPEWREIRNEVQPVTETVWVDDYLALDAVEWARAHRGIVWYEQVAFGQRVAELGGLPLHGGGAEAERLILAERGDRSIVASIKAHGTGRDGLQHAFNQNLFPNPPSSGDLWEQLMGRTHRIGQTADEVCYDAYRHTRELRAAIDSAVRQAKFIEGIMGTYQKLLVADCDFELDTDNC